MIPGKAKWFRQLSRDDREAIGGVLLVLSIGSLLSANITSGGWQILLVVCFFIGSFASIKLVSH
jgi:uncharacterized membrane protein